MILKRKASCVWLVASCFAVFALSPLAFSAERRKPGPEAQKLLDRIRSAPGILLGYNTTNVRSLPVFEKACAKKSVIHEYELAAGYVTDVLKKGGGKGGDDEPGAAESWTGQPGTITMFRWHMRHPVTNSFRSGPIEDLLPGGKHHETLLKNLDYLVERVKRVKKPVIVRPWHEANGGWFWWGGKPEKFIQLWRLTVDYVESKGVNNVLWCYSPNGTEDDDWQTDIFYPGNAYVDIAAIDFYFDVSKTDGHIQNVRAIMKSLLALQAIIPDDMPMGFGEIGPRGPKPEEDVSEETGREWSTFWKNLEPDLKKYLPRVKFLCVWSTTAFEKKLYPTSGIALEGLREFAGCEGVVTQGEKW